MMPGPATQSTGSCCQCGASVGMAAAGELPHEARAALAENRLDGVMFFSPKTARLFLTLAEGLPVAGLTAFCISPATAGALGSGLFAQVRIADRPNQSAMLALVNRA